MNGIKGFSIYGVAVASGIFALAVVYWASLGNGFVEIDDYYFILENTDVHRLDRESVMRIFASSGRDYHYVPLFYLYLAAVYDTFGAVPYYFHLFSLLFHFLSSLLVCYLLLRLTNKRYVAFFTAMIFAVHPMQVEAVCWAAGVKSVLFSLFYLLSLVFYVEYKMRTTAVNGARIAFYTGSLLFFALSMLTKTTAVSLPVVALAIDYFLEKKNEGMNAFLRRCLPDKALFLIVVAIAYYPNMVAASQAPAQVDLGYTFFDHIAIVGNSIFFYVWKSLVPAGLSVYYVPPTKNGDYFSVHYYLLALAGYVVSFAGIFFSLKSRHVFLGVAFFFVPVLIMLDTVLFMTDVVILVADRYFYLSAIGIFFLIGLGIEQLGLRKAGLRKFLLSGALISVIFLGYAAHSQTQVWKNSITLYENTVTHQPCSEFYLRLGREYMDAGDDASAFRNFREGFRRIEDNTIFKANYTAMLTPGWLGIRYGKKEEHELARQYFEMAVEMKPDEGVWWANLGFSLQMLGDSAASAAAYQKAADLGFTTDKQ